MDNNNWRPNPSQGPVVGGGGGGVGGGGVGAPGGGGGEAAMDFVDWRSQVQPDSRQRIVNKIMVTLKRCLPVSGQEGLHELWKIAIKFEEKIYTAATSQSDYLRKIYLKMLTMETKSQNPIGNALPSNSAGNSNKSPDAGPVVGGGGVGGGGIGAPGGGGGEAAMNSVDWRSQLQPDSRRRIVNKVMETLKRHLPVSGQEGLHELRKIAIRFEEKIYTAATSQSDYLRKISLKMLTMETKSQNPIGNALPSNSAGNSNKSPDAGMSMQPQVHNPGQSLPIPLSANQSHQQMLSQNIQNNIPSAGVQSTASLPSALPPVSGLSQNLIPNVVGHFQL